MNWILPYWMMNVLSALFSALSWEIVLTAIISGIFGIVGYFATARFEKKFDFTPTVIFFMVAPIVMLLAFAVWYGTEKSNGTFNKEEALFKDYYYFGRVDGKSAIGKGVLYEKTTLKPVYSGEFERNQRNGEGAQRYGNGDKYVGHWKNNQRDGQGTYYYAWGGRYEGMWKADKQDGAGTYYDEDGKPEKRTYKNGKWIA